MQKSAEASAIQNFIVTVGGCAGFGALACGGIVLLIVILPALLFERILFLFECAMNILTCRLFDLINRDSRGRWQGSLSSAIYYILVMSPLAVSMAFGAAIGTFVGITVGFGNLAIDKVSLPINLALNCVYYDKLPEEEEDREDPEKSSLPTSYAKVTAITPTDSAATTPDYREQDIWGEIIMQRISASNTLRWGLQLLTSYLNAQFDKAATATTSITSSPHH